MAVRSIFQIVSTSVTVTGLKAIGLIRLQSPIPPAVAAALERPV